MDQITHKFDSESKTLIISISGRFDYSSGGGFRTAFSSVKNPRKVTVDLRHTSYMDSSALGMLLILKDIFPSVVIEIVNALEAVREVLMITKFEKIFDIK